MWIDGGDRGADGLEDLWDWYSALRRRKVPVEYWYFPDGNHSVYKIGQRLRASQLLVDWYRFWLKGEEAPGEEKADQYLRWRRMRDHFQGTVAKADDNSGHSDRVGSCSCVSDVGRPRYIKRSPEDIQNGTSSSK